MNDWYSNHDKEWTWYYVVIYDNETGKQIINDLISPNKREMELAAKKYTNYRYEAWVESYKEKGHMEFGAWVPMNRRRIR